MATIDEDAVELAHSAVAGYKNFIRERVAAIRPEHVLQGMKRGVFMIPFDPNRDREALSTNRVIDEAMSLSSEPLGITMIHYIPLSDSDRNNQVIVFTRDGHVGLAMSTDDGVVATAETFSDTEQFFDGFMPPESALNGVALASELLHSIAMSLNDIVPEPDQDSPA